MESSLSLDRAELDIRWTFFHHPMRLITLMFDRPTAYPILVIIECESFSDWVSQVNWPRAREWFQVPMPDEMAARQTDVDASGIFWSQFSMTANT